MATSIRICARAAVLLAAAVLAPTVAAAPADLDASFGTGGLVTADFAALPSETANAVAVAPEGKIVAAGYASGAMFNLNAFAVARFNPDGSPDPTFGSGGQVITDLGALENETAHAVVVQPDGKTVIAGSAVNRATGEVFALVRYNADGSRDAGFGVGGVVSTAFPIVVVGGARGVALQPDGKIVVAGSALIGGAQTFAVARYDGAGVLDPSFGSGGIATAPSFFYWEQAEARAVAMQPDGKIVVGGAAAGQFVLARFTPTGTLDATFGSGGIARPTGGSAWAVAVQRDGKIVEAGRDGSGFQFGVSRVNADGSNDVGFGVGGTATADFSTQGVQAAAEAVQIQANGKIVAAGMGSGSRLFFALARFGADGTLDPGFGTSGRVLTSFPAATGAWTHGLALQPNGAIVAAGSAYRAPDGSQVFALARYVGDPVTTTVTVDVRPWSLVNPIKVGSAGVVPVAVLSTAGFDATKVDPRTVCFGDADDAAQRDCTEESGAGHVQDVNEDGRRDLLLRYEVNETGIDPGDSTACLGGSTFSGTTIEGCDSIRTL
jgi:uncharacterized delta-60 repeat protein